MDAALTHRLLAGVLALVLATPIPTHAEPAPVALPAAAGAVEPPETETETAIAKEEVPAPSRTRAKWLAAGGLALTYGAFSTYAYFAWFRGKQNGGDGFTFDGFGLHTYAGGADKLGHAWSAYAVTRGTTAMLTYAGWPRFGSSVVAASVSQIFFTLSEYEDSLVYQFEVNDIVANVVGAAFAVAMTNLPELDRWIDFRLEYFPSKDYRRTVREEGNIDFFQDYSGQSYMLALHLDAIPHLPRTLRFVDVVGGFETRHYSPPREDRSIPPMQRLYLGVSLNLQAVLAEVFADSRGRRVAHGAFEHLSVPFTTWKAIDASRTQ